MTINKPMARFLERVVADPGVADHLRTSAAKMLEAHKADRRRHLAKTLPRRKTEAELEAEQRERHANLVLAAMARDGHLCQLCPPEATHRDRMGKTSDPLDGHHLELGSGKTKNERLENLITSHRSCHDAFHANAKAFVARVKAWCARNGYRLPNRRIYRDV